MKKFLLLLAIIIPINITTRLLSAPDDTEKTEIKRINTIIKQIDHRINFEQTSNKKDALQQEVESYINACDAIIKPELTALYTGIVSPLAFSQSDAIKKYNQIIDIFKKLLALFDAPPQSMSKEIPLLTKEAYAIEEHLNTIYKKVAESKTLARQKRYAAILLSHITLNLITLLKELSKNLLTPTNIASQTTTPIGLSNKGNTCFLNALLQNLLNMTELNNELLMIPEQKLSAQDSSRLGLSNLLLNIPTVRYPLFAQQNLSAYERRVLENQVKLQKQLQAYRELYLAIHTDHSPTRTIIDEKLATFVTTVCQNQWKLNVGGRQEDPTEALDRFFPSMTPSATEPWKWFVYLIDEQKIQFNNNSMIIPRTAARYNTPLSYQSNKNTIDDLLRAGKWQCNENLACSKKNSFDEINTKNIIVALPVNISIKTIQQAIDLYQQEEIIDPEINLEELKLKTDERKLSRHIFSQSNYLILSLKRFDDNLQKISVPVAIQKNITIPNKENGLVVFELVGIIIHSGRALQGGHYVTYIADQQNSDHRWYLCNDEIITPAPNMFNRNKNAVGLSGYNPTTDGYVLFYKRASYNPVPVILKK